MDRIRKEEFVEKAWEHFRTEEDVVEMPALPYLTDAGLDAMYSHFSYCYQEEKI